MSESPATSPAQADLPSGLTPVWVIAYLTAYRLWSSLGPRPPYFFSEPLALAFLLSAALVLWQRGRAGEIKSYLVGRWWPGRGQRYWLALLPAATVSWFLLWSQHYPSAPFTTPGFIDDVVTSPLTEEPVYRGIFLTILLCHFRGRRFWPVLLAAVIFASMHRPPTWQRLANHVGFAMILGYGFAVTRCLPLCVFCHALSNAMSYWPFLSAGGE